MDENSLDPSIPRKMFYKIGEVSRIFGVKPYVLRYWESEFKQIRPAKNRFGQRVYRQKDLVILSRIKKLLYNEKFTIAGAKKQLAAEKAARQNKALGSPGNGNGPKEAGPMEFDLAIYMHLLREHKDQLLEILNIVKSESEMQPENEVGA